jgi:hypothetical protein
MSTERATIPILEGRADAIADGDVIAFKRSGFWSAAIRWRTRSKISHVGFALWIGEHLCVLEAQEGRGVQIVPMSAYRADTLVEAFWYGLAGARPLHLGPAAAGIDRKKLIDHAMEHLGCRYVSFWQFLRSWGVLTERLCDYFGIAKDLDPQRFFCSEFVLSSLRAAGYRGNPEDDPARTSPGEICQLSCLEYRGQVA